MESANFFRTLIFFMVLFPFSQSSAGTVLEIDSDRQISFAEHYFSNEEYPKAIDEYKRFIFFFPEDDRIEMAMYKIGMSYFNTGHFKKAAEAFSKIIDREYAEIGNTKSEIRSSDYITKAYYMITECYMKLNAYGHAVSNLRNLLAIKGDKDVTDETYYRLGWIHLETGRWKEAGSFFEQISPENSDKYRLKELSAELSKEISIPEKSPWTAGFLSVIPGGGYLYCERYHDALVAFLVNTILGYAAYESLEDENYALGGLIGFIEMGFYSGNIYGAISSAHKHNRAKQLNFIEKLKQNTMINLSRGGYENRGVVISLRYSF